MRVLALFLFAGCATSADLGLLQHSPGDGTGGSINGHVGVGLVPAQILVASVDLRGDVATSGDRFAVGASVLGGLPIGRFKALGRVGVWHSALTTADDRSLVPSFELAGFIPLTDQTRDPAHPERGAGDAGIVIGVREDLDQRTYTTIFLGLSLFLMPGY